MPPNEINCPLCVYKGCIQHYEKVFILKSEVSIIGEFCKTEMIPLDKCCLNCLDSLNECQFLLSCEQRKKKYQSYEKFTDSYHEKRGSKKQKSCYQNCFMKDSTLWNFVILNHMMADDNLYEVIMYEIEQTVGLVDCQLQKVRMKETVGELCNGLQSAQLLEYFDHWSNPLEMNALFESFKQQWNSFRFGNGVQEAGSLCKCTVIWNEISENKVKKEKYEDLKTTMIDMARYSMTEEIHGCPMEYYHGIELNMDVMKELRDTINFGHTGQETNLTEMRNEEVRCLVKRLASNIFPFAHLYCRNEEEQLFDKKTHQPCTGFCKHTICLMCIKKTPNGDCPVCGKEGSFKGYQVNGQLIQEIDTIKKNAWEMFKELWKNEAAEPGACSKCNKHSDDLHICDIDNLTIWCSGSRRLRMDTTADVLKLSRSVLCQECASAQVHATEKLNYISFWKHYLKKTNGIFLLAALEDEIEGKNYEARQTEIQKNRKVLIKVLGELHYVGKLSCGYDRELIKLKLVDKLMQSIDQNMKQLFMPDKNPYELIEERNCPMCVMIGKSFENSLPDGYVSFEDLLACAKNKSEQNHNEWMNVFEHLWNNQSPKFEKCCSLCLFYFKNRYSASCQTQSEVVNMKNLSNAISEGIEESQVKNFRRVLSYMNCKDCNDPVDDKEIWQNLIIREYFLCALQIITKGLLKTTFACHLRKIRIYSLVYQFLSVVCDVWLMNNQNWIFFWKFFKPSSMFESLRIQFKKLRDEMDKKEIGVKCECTDIWGRNQNMMRKFGHKDCEEKRKHQDLEDLMEEMARFTLEEDLDGCPMQYDHGIELDEELVRKLKETTDLEAERNKNKCLCVVIDSFAPNSKISDANVNHIVSFYINWWKYEATYSHSRCDECIFYLELIKNRLETLSGFYNCELRKMRMLKTFNELIDIIDDFLISKGRIFKSDMESMTKLFDSFISQWNCFQFGADSDHRTWTAGTVCHCTKKLDKFRSLKNAVASRKNTEKYAYLMSASKIFSEFNLTEIITGCPLDFNHGYDVDSFYRERWDKSKILFCDVD